MFGWFMDHALPHWVFGASACFMLATVMLAMVSERKPKAAIAQATH
jgi:hypothetical protein